MKNKLNNLIMEVQNQLDTTYKRNTREILLCLTETDKYYIELCNLYGSDNIDDWYDKLEREVAQYVR